MHPRWHARTVGGMMALVVAFAVARAGADCAAPSSCTCESVRDRVLLRATVREVGNGAVTLRITEVLSRADTASFASGDLVSGAFTRGPPCGSPDGHIVVTGDEVFAAAQKEFVLPSNGGCGEAGVCRATLWMVPWQDTLRLAGDDAIPAGRASELGEPTSCLARFPAPELGPCNDVRTVGGCAIARPPPGAPHSAGALLLLCVAATRQLRRARAPLSGRAAPSPASLSTF